jgi:hypothetical protein
VRRNQICQVGGNIWHLRAIQLSLLQNRPLVAWLAWNRHATNFAPLILS